MKVRIGEDADDLRPVARIRVRTEGGLNLVQRIRIRTEGGLRLAFSALTASVDPATATASLYARGSPTITTPSVTVTPSGGIAPYSYAWTNPDPDWSAQSPSDAFTSFIHGSVAPGETYATTFICTVTDAAGSTAGVAVSAQVSNTYISFA